MRKILFKTRFGSHLYGTNTASSDTDYKGIYISSFEDIILSKDKQTIHKNTKMTKEEGVRNSKEDTDFEIIELRKFIKDALSGQTYAIDMLFSTEDMWEATSEEWEFILKNREKMLSKNVAPFIGYCRKQAAKYGLKGSRLGEVIRLMEYLEDKNATMQFSECIEMYPFIFSEFIRIEEREHHHKGRVVKQTFLQILNKYYPVQNMVKEIRSSLESFHKRYGSRSIDANKNEGVDWKAISHAYRAVYQLEELANTGKITFPLKNKEYVLKVKMGEVDYADVVQEELPRIMEEAIAKVEYSQYLPESPDFKFWEDFIIKTYKKYL